ncbi:MAG: cysteine desulfurase [Chloroflexi bacterium]|nr:cysteine desulfurase [Chloroflexota bacterium]
MSKRIYLDHAATTPVHPQALEAMLPFFSESFGNPSSIYLRGRAALEAVEQARQTVADMLGAKPSEIVFTAGGSESDNLAIRGVALARRANGHAHLITSAIEHHAVLYTCQQLERQFGYTVTYVPVDAYGRIAPDEVARAIRPETVLISVMMANNEVGTIQPIEEIGRIARAKDIPFHTDAVQAGGTLPLDVNRLGVDFLSLSAHKFYGPKGVGILYAREGVKFLPMQTGGGQERNRRAGTEYTAGIVGAAKALELAEREREPRNGRLTGLRDRLLDEVPARVAGAQVTGHRAARLPNNASFVIEGVEGETLILGLDQAGIEASTGSACTSGSTEPSHVLKALGVADELARGSLRLTLGVENSEADIDYVLETLPGLIARLR